MCSPPSSLSIHGKRYVAPRPGFEPKADGDIPAKTPPLFSHFLGVEVTTIIEVVRAVAGSETGELL